MNNFERVNHPPFNSDNLKKFIIASVIYSIIFFGVIGYWVYRSISSRSTVLNKQQFSTTSSLISPPVFTQTPTISQPTSILINRWEYDFGWAELRSRDQYEADTLRSKVQMISWKSDQAEFFGGIYMISSDGIVPEHPLLLAVMVPEIAPMNSIIYQYQAESGVWEPLETHITRSIASAEITKFGTFAFGIDTVSPVINLSYPEDGEHVTDHFVLTGSFKDTGVGMYGDTRNFLLMDHPYRHESGAVRSAIYRLLRIRSESILFV